MNGTVYRSTRWGSLICPFIVSSLSSELSILVSYQVLIEWVNTRLEKWLRSNFSDHCGNIKFPRCDRSTAFCLRYFIVFMAEVTKQAATVPKTTDGFSFSLLYFVSHWFAFFFFFPLTHTTPVRTTFLILISNQELHMSSYSWRAEVWAGLNSCIAS